MKKIITLTFILALFQFSSIFCSERSQTGSSSLNDSILFDLSLLDQKKYSAQKKIELNKNLDLPFRMQLKNRMYNQLIESANAITDKIEEAYEEGHVTEHEKLFLDSRLEDIIIDIQLL